MKKAGSVPSNGAILQLKITLDESSPRVWRRILVPKQYSFFDLHVAIQDAMGWCDGHLHGFRFANKKNNWQTIHIGFPMPDDEYAERLTDERTAKIRDYLGVISKQCVYEYDFGDGWEHTVLLEQGRPKEAGARYPQCLAGKNACPPEDCGGLGGYDRLQEILKNPKHKEHKEMLEWMGLENTEEFDPTAFTTAGVEFADPKERLREYERGFSESR